MPLIQSQSQPLLKCEIPSLMRLCVYKGYEENEDLYLHHMNTD